MEGVLKSCAQRVRSIFFQIPLFHPFRAWLRHTVPFFLSGGGPLG